MYSVSSYASYLPQGVAGHGDGRYFIAKMCVVLPLAYVVSGYVENLPGVGGEGCFPVPM